MKKEFRFTRFNLDKQLAGSHNECDFLSKGG